MSHFSCSRLNQIRRSSTAICSASNGSQQYVEQKEFRIEQVYCQLQEELIGRPLTRLGVLYCTVLKSCIVRFEQKYKTLAEISI